MDFHDTAVFAPWAEASPDPRVKARGAIDLRLHGPTGVTSAAEQSEPDRVQPTSLRIRDAWVGTRGEWVDLQVGAQRIAWGVGAGLSLVDNMNPYDLEDPTRFDRRLSTASALGTLHHGAWSLQTAAAPFFVPAALPEGAVSVHADADELFDASATGAGDVQIGALESRTSLPGADPLDGNFAVRMRWTPAWGDVALSGLHGRDSLPQVDGEVLLTGYQTDADRVDIAIPIRYPRQDIVGLELRGSLPGDVGGWAEATMTWPERTVATTSRRQLEALERLGTITEVPDPLPQTVTQDGESYARWLVGLDRATGPVYLNLQWLHGFPTERQTADLRDYAMLATRWTATPTLRVELSGATDLTGWLANAQVTLLHGDAAELGLGVTWIEGSDDSALGGLRGVRHGRVTARQVF